MSDDHNGRYVTVRELADKLARFRWEVRFWFIAALAASHFVPQVSAPTSVALRFARHIF